MVFVLCLKHFHLRLQIGGSVNESEGIDDLIALISSKRPTRQLIDIFAEESFNALSYHDARGYLTAAAMQAWKTMYATASQCMP